MQKRGQAWAEHKQIWQIKFAAGFTSCSQIIIFIIIVLVITLVIFKLFSSAGDYSSPKTSDVLQLDNDYIAH